MNLSHTPAPFPNQSKANILLEWEKLAQRFEIATTHSNIGVWEYDIKTDKTWRSLSHDLVHGYTERIKEWNVQIALEHVHLEDRDKFNLSLDHAMKSGEDWKTEYRIIWPDKTVHWVSVKGILVKDNTGRPEKIIGVTTDITDRKEAEMALEKAAKDLKQIIDTQPTLISYVNTDETYKFCNDAYRVWFGIESRQITDRKICDLVSPAVYEKISPFLKEALQGKIQMFKAWITYPTGPKYIHAIYQPDFNSEGRVIGIFITVDDMTKEQRNLEALEEEKVLRSKFVSTLSHDLRTPLSVARLNSEFLQRRFKDETIQKHTTKTITNLDRVNEMIENLLDASKIHAGKLVLPEKNQQDLIALMKETIDDLIVIHGDRFKLVAPERLKVTIWKNGIRRVLENLCSNAIKYGSQDGPVEINVDSSGKDFIISVHNKGHPLSSMATAELFEPFKRGSASEILGKKGWGIGLTIVKGITEAHHGHVSVESDEKGTTFKIRLPI